MEITHHNKTSNNKIDYYLFYYFKTTRLKDANIYSVTMSIDYSKNVNNFTFPDISLVEKVSAHELEQKKEGHHFRYYPERHLVRYLEFEFLPSCVYWFDTKKAYFGMFAGIQNQRYSSQSFANTITLYVPDKNNPFTPALIFPDDEQLKKRLNRSGNYTDDLRTTYRTHSFGLDHRNNAHVYVDLYSRYKLYLLMLYDKLWKEMGLIPDVMGHIASFLKGTGPCGYELIWKLQPSLSPYLLGETHPLFGGNNEKKNYMLQSV